MDLNHYWDKPEIDAQNPPRPRSTLTRMYTRDRRYLECAPEIGTPAHGVARDRPHPRMTPEIGGLRTPLA